MKYPYTADEAAIMLGISAALVRRYCRQGRLGKRIGNQWLITDEEIKEFEAKPRKVGNPEFGPGFWKARIAPYHK